MRFFKKNIKILLFFVILSCSKTGTQHNETLDSSLNRTKVTTKEEKNKSIVFAKVLDLHGNPIKAITVFFSESSQTQIKEKESLLIMRRSKELGVTFGRLLYPKEVLEKINKKDSKIFQGEHAITDQDGIVQFEVSKPGKYQLNASNGNDNSFTEFEITSLEEKLGTYFILRLNPSKEGSLLDGKNGLFSITGKVYDPIGTPLSDAMVKINYSGKEGLVKTDRFGKFEFLNLPQGSIMLTITHSKYAPVLKNYVELSNKEEVVYLTEGIQLYGQVLDNESLRAIKDARVFLKINGLEFQVLTDFRGNYILPPISHGEGTISIESSGYVKNQKNFVLSSQSSVWTKDKKPIEKEQIYLVRSGSIEGVLLDTNGSKITNLEVDVFISGQNYSDNFHIKTDSQGKFFLQGIYPGLQKLSVRFLGKEMNTDLHVQAGEITMVQMVATP